MRRKSSFGDWKGRQFATLFLRSICRFVVCVHQCNVCEFVQMFKCVCVKRKLQHRNYFASLSDRFRIYFFTWNQTTAATISAEFCNIYLVNAQAGALNSTEGVNSQFSYISFINIAINRFVLLKWMESNVDENTFGKMLLRFCLFYFFAHCFVCLRLMRLCAWSIQFKCFVCLLFIALQH